MIALARIASLVTLCALAGCSVEIARLAAISASDVDDARESLGHREGQVCRWWLLGVPFGLPTLEAALEAATAPVGGRLVRDAVVTSDHSVWVVVGQNCYTIKGEVFR